MAKFKRDWIALKKDFMKSKFTEAKSFLDSIGIAYNAQTRKMAKGWSKEKAEIREGGIQKALLKQQEKLANQLEVPAELCLANIKKSIELSAKKLEQMEEKENINTKDLNNIRAMNRIQNGMPTTYVKSENENTNTERVESIHIIIGMNPIDSTKKD